ncbi:probable flavin-containing monoamine oxidase A isoform X2 [Homarus americanus]|uniref:probable flavin-containing monoamine oxidase A isoform X2 n=1 Tax=Homarus americanus TaxID=6706 RepID=UPI001C483144|nr:probable flavin-containing monoamine oxidase A isoform X2 [Homarus americanus]
MIYDVAVIGAGAAGLTAAHKLLQADPNLTLVVLEAKDRVGGRTLTVPVDIGDGKTDTFDMGGQWVGSSQHHVLNMMEELGLRTYPQYTEGTKVMQLGDNKIRTYTGDIPSLGSLRGLIQLQLFIWKAERMAAKVPITDPYSSKYAAELGGETVSSFMKKHISNKAAMEAIDVGCKASFGTEASRISALFFMAYANSAGGVMKVFETKKDAAQELRVMGGTQQISELLADKIGKEKVLLSHPVCEMKQTTDSVEVKTENGKCFTARRVIMTAPPNQLIKMKFDPPLPPYKQLIYENHPIGHLIKFYVTYKKAFWRDNGYSGEIVSNGGETEVDGVSRGPLSACFDATTHTGTPAIVGFIAGRQGVEWHNKTEAERKKAVIDGLSSTLGSEAQDYVTYIEKVWADEPYTGGCPVMFGVPGTMYAFPHLRLPFDRLHFAGTETATVWTGFISGAIQSGERAAKEALQYFRPELLTEKDLLGTCHDPKSIPSDIKMAK